MSALFERPGVPGDDLDFLVLIAGLIALPLLWVLPGGVWVFGLLVSAAAYLFAPELAMIWRYRRARPRRA